VLKSCANRGFYAGGKLGWRGSVNRCFFGVNIVFFNFSFTRSRRKRFSFSTVSHYLSVLRAILLKSVDHVLIIYWSGYPRVISPHLAVDFGADGGYHFNGGYVDELFAKYQVKG
jgi:hypothetical protein